MSKDDCSYDGAVILKTPVQIRDDHDEVITIYGLLYNREQKHKDELWIGELNRYICYLQGCERVQEKGCRLAPGLVITATNNIIALNSRLKNLIYRMMKDDLTDYRLLEPEKPFTIEPDEVEDMFIISKQFVKRIQA